MLTLPINANTFEKSFLDGNGSFEISTDQNTWQALYEADQPFSKNVQDLVDLKFSIGTSKSLKFGKRNKLSLNVDFNSETAGRIELIWPDDDSEVIRKYKLEDSLSSDKLYMAILFNARADMGAESRFPVGPLSASFGVGAGGYVGYERLVPYDQTRSVREILTDLFRGIRLPQNIDAPVEIPLAGEVLTTSYGGYLNLTARLNWATR